jgi:butyryl-CoA dehydrogenase
VELRKNIAEARELPELKPHAESLEKALEILQRITGHLTEVARDRGPEIFLADATLYLEFFGIISVAWQWLLQGIIIVNHLKRTPSEAEKAFLDGKFYTLRYFFSYELPKIQGLAERLTNSDGLTVEVKPEHFFD